MISKNIGKKDKYIRITVALILITYGAVKQYYFPIGFGILLMITAVIQWCSFYQIFDFKTCEKK